MARNERSIIYNPFVGGFTAGGFYVTEQALGRFVPSQQSYSSFYKLVNVGLTMIGVSFFVGPVTRYITRRCRLKKMQMRPNMRIGQPNMGCILPYIANSTGHRFLAGPVVTDIRQKEKGSNGMAVNRLDRTDRDLCRICFENEYDSTFIPCGHMCCCVNCSLPLIWCPVCRGRIEWKVKTFRP